MVRKKVARLLGNRSNEPFLSLWCNAGKILSMLLFDAHLDLAWNAIDWNRDLKLPVADIRRREVEQKIQGKARGVNTVSFPDLRRGRVGLFIATLLARLHRPGMMPAFSRYDNMD